MRHEETQDFCSGIGGPAATRRICINDANVNLDRRRPHPTTTALAKVISLRIEE